MATDGDGDGAGAGAGDGDVDGDSSIRDMRITFSRLEAPRWPYAVKNPCVFEDSLGLLATNIPLPSGYAGGKSKVGPKMALSWPQDGPGRPQEAPRRSKLAEDGPKKPHRGPQMVKHQ